jgi:hypothetical protein
MFIRHLSLVFLLAVTGRLAAETLQFPDNNFTQEIPSSWESTPPPDPNVLIALQSKTGGQTVLVSSVKLPEREYLIGVSAVRTGIKSSYEKAGLTIDSEASATVNGVPYLMLKAHNDAPRYFHAYVTSSNGIIYAFQHISDTDEKAGGSGFKSVLEGFKLIRPLPFHAALPPEPSAASKFGYALGVMSRKYGLLILLVFLAGVGGCIYLMLKKKKRRRRRY